MDMKKWINMCLFMSMTFILIQIKFDIDIHNDELLKTIWKHTKRKRKVDCPKMGTRSKVKLKLQDSKNKQKYINILTL